jgi:CheY-like chemotaxis protein
MTNCLVALVVEDEAMLRFSLAEDLQAAGYTTYEAANAAEAIEVMEANSDIRVVFTDIQMPGTMDGLALSHYVRKRWPPTIIVVLSGRAVPSEDEMASGAMFLGKPYASHTLNRVLADIRPKLC